MEKESFFCRRGFEDAEIQEADNQVGSSLLSAALFLMSVGHSASTPPY